MSDEDGYSELMERARMEAWRRVSPMSNLHSGSCGGDCYNPTHYPAGSPLDDDELTDLARQFLGEVNQREPTRAR